MIRRLLLLLGAALLVEAAAFLSTNQDLVLLSRPVTALQADPGFEGAARHTLARPRVSRRVLVHVADVARLRGNDTLRLEALRRVVHDAPHDQEALIALADGLREVGRHDEAEAIYRRLLDDGGASRP